MASKSETGHAKNVAHFEELIAFCVTYGPSYNPAKAELKLPALNQTHAAAVAALANVNDLLTVSIMAINSREEAFSGLSKLVTRVIQALSVSNVAPSLIADAKTYARKLKGQRATPVKDADAPGTKKHSVSQMSYDQRIENMDKLVHLLAVQPGYAPNETELSVASLQANLASLRTVNTTVINANTALSNARIARNKLLYDAGTGLFDQAASVKLYVKSVFGNTGPEAKQMSTLKFTKPR